MDPNICDTGKSIWVWVEVGLTCKNILLPLMVLMVSILQSHGCTGDAATKAACFRWLYSLTTGGKYDHQSTDLKCTNICSVFEYD